ncbi:MAG: hypothetical protein AAF490_21255, partial [Chloroflexota bacterium]
MRLVGKRIDFRDKRPYHTPMEKLQTLSENFVFNNRFEKTLPADPVTVKTPRQVFQSGYSHVEPTPVSGPKLVAWSQEAADLLDFSPEFVQSENFLAA